MKTQILAVLCEKGPQVATALDVSSIANNPVKAAVSLLQIPPEHAQHLELAAAILHAEAAV